MSTNLLATGIDLSPSAAAGNKFARLWDHIRKVLGAISDGREAEHAYRQLVSRGVAPDRAARLVLTDVLGHS